MNAKRHAWPWLAVWGILMVGGPSAGCGASSAQPAVTRVSNSRENSEVTGVALATNGASVQAESIPITIDADTDAEKIPNLWTRKIGVDWPKFLGPTGDSKSPERGIQAPWPKQGPRIVWQRAIGEGYGIGSVSRGRFLQFDRFGAVARLVCLNAETGDELWKFEYPTDYEDLYQYNGGPRASPIVDGDRVYIYGAEGRLHCLSLIDGNLIWKNDTRPEFGVIQNFFGVGSTPIIVGDLILVMVGGSPPEDKRIPPGELDRVSPNGSAIVAFDKLTGAVRYKVGDDLASYASLKLATIDGRPWCLAFCREGLLALEPRSGTIDFHFPWRTKTLESVNASTPVVDGTKVFISETYGVGSTLLDVSGGRPEIVWQDSTNRREKSFKAHWNTPILIDGYLYGCSGRNPPDAELRCIRWKTGAVQWSEPNRIRTSLLYVDGHFVCLGEYGALQLIKVNPKKLDVVSEVKLRDSRSFDVLPPGLEPPGLLRAPCWAAPILSHGLLYVRGDDRLVCLELIPETP